MSAIPTFLSVDEISAATGKSRVTIWRWTRDGLFPIPVRIGPNSTAWRHSDYLDWAADPAGWPKRCAEKGTAA